MAKDNILYPKKDPPTEEDRLRLKRSIAIVTFNIGLLSLARLGRPGQWVLHNEEFYSTEIDTKPAWRTLVYKVPVPGQKTLVWAGKGPVPDFQDIAFWEAKRKDLDAKIQQIEDGAVEPQFTPAELQAIEAMEQQKGHYFYDALGSRRYVLLQAKWNVFRAMVALAALGRAGQWILHGLDIYSPTIDTRPHTRRPVDQCVAFHETSPTPGGYRWSQAMQGKPVAPESQEGADTKKRFDFELVWDGDGARDGRRRPQPDFDHTPYWDALVVDLREHQRVVGLGLVRPAFTPAERRFLDSDSTFPKHALPGPPRLECLFATPAPPETAAAMACAHKKVADAMHQLWASGLAGKWVLYNESLYLPAYDTRMRKLYDLGDGRTSVALDVGKADMMALHDRRRFGDLSFDSLLFRRQLLYLQQQLQQTPALSSLWALPDFGNLAFWERKHASLQAQWADIKAGRLTEHHFTPGDLMCIELLERQVREQREQAENAGQGTDEEDEDQDSAWEKDPRTGRVKAWLAQTGPEDDMETPPSPPPSSALWLPPETAA